MKNKLMKTLMITVMTVSMVMMAACGKAEDNGTSSAEESTSEVVSTESSSEESSVESTVEESSEEAAKTFTVKVVDGEGAETSCELNLVADTLYDNLVANEFSFDGYDGDWGFYVTTVNDIVADYDADGAYWSIYVNGDYGMYGVSEQPVAEGDVISFVYEVYVAESYVTVEVSIADEVTTYYAPIGEAATLKELMDAMVADETIDFTYDGYESDWGYMVTTVNGKLADYNVDASYWAIYVNGEYGMYGVGEQPLAEGETYSFIYTAE